MPKLNNQIEKAEAELSTLTASGRAWVDVSDALGDDEDFATCETERYHLVFVNAELCVRSFIDQEAVDDPIPLSELSEPQQVDVAAFVPQLIVSAREAQEQLAQDAIAAAVNIKSALRDAS